MIIDKNYLNHSFIDGNINMNMYGHYTCEKCKKEIYYNDYDFGYYDDEYPWKKIELTCEEVIIKGIIE